LSRLPPFFELKNFSYENDVVIALANNLLNSFARSMAVLIPTLTVPSNSHSRPLDRAEQKFDHSSLPVLISGQIHPNGKPDCLVVTPICEVHIRWGTRAPPGRVSVSAGEAR
jgi:hypothetical protein